MTEGIDCPVCERHGLTPDCESCPQCDADLTCFQALDLLRTERIASTAQRGNIPSNSSGAGLLVYIAVFGAALALAALSFVMGRFDRRLDGMGTAMVAAIHDKGMEQDVNTVRLHIHKLQVNYEDSFSRMEEVVKSHGAEIKRINTALVSLKGELENRLTVVVSKEKDENTFFYYTRKTDTLWGIARRFYGEGKYYPFIMEHNPHLVISDITEGIRMQLISDSDPVALEERYDMKTEWKNGTLLWKYIVQPEDTEDSIYARFVAPGKDRQVFFDAGVKIVPSETVRIILR